MKRIVPLALSLALAGLLCARAPSVVADPPRPLPPVDEVAALEGGTPLPDTAATYTFPWMPKQSVIAISDAEAERMVASVDFSDPGLANFGTVSLDGKGGGTGSFKVASTDLKTVSSQRDEHLQGEMWLDAKKFPDVVFTITKLERLKPTVYRASGTWKMHGVEKPISVLANVRLIPKIEHFGENIARLKARLSLNLKDFGVANPYVGSNAVAEAWTVDLVVLGVPGEPKAAPGGK